MLPNCTNGIYSLILLTAFLWKWITCCGRLHEGHFHYSEWTVTLFHEAPLCQAVYCDQYTEDVLFYVP